MDLLSVSLFALALLLNAGSPGPSITALVARVVTHGWRDVLPFVAAMWIGEVLWLTLAMAGLTTLSESFHAGFLALKWAGIAYLCWLAFRMWRTPPTSGDDLPRRQSPWAMFSAGMALTLGNPKIMVFYLALLPALIDLSGAGVAQWAVLAPVTLLCLAAADLTWIALAQKARGWLKTPRARRLANRISAGALGGAAALLAARA